MNKLLLPVLLLLSGCVSSIVQTDYKLNAKAPPQYEDYFDGYLFGWVGGKEKVDLVRVCMDQKPYGFQKLHSGEDLFFAVITFGIYTPTTVRVWCGE
jgi:hypothetical protein